MTAVLKTDYHRDQVVVEGLVTRSLKMTLKLVSVMAACQDNLFEQASRELSNVKLGKSVANCEIIENEEVKSQAQSDITV